MGVRPIHFPIGTIIIIVGLPIESHHHTSSVLTTFIENISIVVISQRNHEFGPSEKN